MPQISEKDIKVSLIASLFTPKKYKQTAAYQLNRLLSSVDSVRSSITKSKFGETGLTSYRVDIYGRKPIYLVPTEYIGNGIVILDKEADIENLGNMWKQLRSSPTYHLKPDVYKNVVEWLESIIKG